MKNAEKYIFGFMLGLTMFNTYDIERDVRILRKNINLRDSTILRLEKSNRLSDSLMWDHIEKTDSMYLEAVRKLRR
jgi:hypothetical protein